METEKIVTGLLDENCYVLKKNGTCLVVDPGDDYEKIAEDYKPDAILLIVTSGYAENLTKMYPSEEE